MGIKAKLEQLAADHAAKLDEIQSVIDSAGDDGLTQEQDDSIQLLQESAEQIEEQIKELEQKQERLAKYAEDLEKARQNAPSSTVRGIISTPETTRQTIPATARRHGTLKAFSGEVGGLQPEERAYRFGQFCLAKLRNDLPQYFGGQFAQSAQFTRDEWAFVWAT